MSRLEQWHPWRVLIGQWGPGFAPTVYVAHYRVVGHCVRIMAAHGVSQTGFKVQFKGESSEVYRKQLLP